MSQARMKWVRELMIDGEFAAARALLETLDRDTSTLMLLAELEEIAPQTASAPAPQRGWEYCELAWRITGFTEGITGSYDLAEAVLHRFSLIIRAYSGLNLQDLALSSIDFRIGKLLDTYSETDTNALNARLGSDPEAVARFFQEQPEAFRAAQRVVLNELNGLLEMALRAHLTRLGMEGWELVTIRTRQPDAWSDLHENVKIQVIELSSLYYLKRPLR